MVVEYPHPGPTRSARGTGLSPGLELPGESSGQGQARQKNHVADEGIDGGRSRAIDRNREEIQNNVAGSGDRRTDQDASSPYPMRCRRCSNRKSKNPEEWPRPAANSKARRGQELTCQTTAPSKAAAPPPTQLRSPGPRPAKSAEISAVSIRSRCAVSCRLSSG